jgi:hypothetical protein
MWLYIYSSTLEIRKRATWYPKMVRGDTAACTFSEFVIVASVYKDNHSQLLVL